MKLTRHGANLLQLTRLRLINCFLVREDDGFTLIDTGIPGSTDAIVKAAQEGGAPIVRIALTHAHADHVGSLDALHAALPAAQVAISARDARFLAGDLSLDPGEPQVKLRGSYQTCATKPELLLHDGDMLGSLRAVSSPGHTPGHMAFYDTRDGSLIAGDAFQTVAGVEVASTFRLLFPLPAIATWHAPTALASARRLRALNPTRLAVGHGRVVAQPLPALDAALVRSARALGETARGA